MRDSSNEVWLSTNAKQQMQLTVARSRAAPAEQSVRHNRCSFRLSIIIVGQLPSPSPL
jgi:hypothetical protein